MSVLPGVAKAVVKSDTVDLDTPGQIYIGTAGDIVIIAENSFSSVTIKNHPVGYLPGRVRRVLNTGTTAADLVVWSS